MVCWGLGYGHTGMCGFRNAHAMTFMRSQDNPGYRPSPFAVFETGPLCCFSAEKSRLPGLQASRDSDVPTSHLPVGVLGLPMFVVNV